MEELLQFLKDAGAFYFTTVEGREPRVRPFGFHMFYDGKLYFGVGDQKAAYKEMKDNPNVELCAFKDGKFLRIRGKAVFDLRPEVQAHQFEVSPFLQKTYNAETGHTHVNFYLEEMSAMLFPMGGEPKKLV